MLVVLFPEGHKLERYITINVPACSTGVHVYVHVQYINSIRLDVINICMYKHVHVHVQVIYMYMYMHVHVLVYYLKVTILCGYLKRWGTNRH